MPDTPDEFAERLRVLILAAFHEWGYIDESVMCGVDVNGVEYHNHVAAEELADSLLALGEEPHDA